MARVIIYLVGLTLAVFGPIEWLGVISIVFGFITLNMDRHAKTR